MGHFHYVCLVFAEDKLADFEGLLRTIRPRSGPSWVTGKIRWARRNRNRLRTMMREQAAGANHPPGDRLRIQGVRGNRADIRRVDLARANAIAPNFRGQHSLR